MKIENKQNKTKNNNKDEIKNRNKNKNKNKNKNESINKKCIKINNYFSILQKEYLHTCKRTK